MSAPTIHASAVLAGSKAVLIQGPSGSGKSRLVWAILRAGLIGELPFTRLVGDDRVHVEARHGRLLVRPAATLAGLIEMRGLGIRRLPYEPVAAVGLVVTLGEAEFHRFPTPEARVVTIDGVRLPHVGCGAGATPLPLVTAWLRTAATGN
jgi:HPr kinase/phosphorylase